MSRVDFSTSEVSDLQRAFAVIRGHATDSPDRRYTLVVMEYAGLRFQGVSHVTALRTLLHRLRTWYPTCPNPWSAVHDHDDVAAHG